MNVSELKRVTKLWIRNKGLEIILYIKRSAIKLYL